MYAGCMPEKRKLIDPVEIGSKGDRARAESLSTLEPQESGRSAAKARWDAYYRLRPEKLQAKQERAAKKAKAAEPAKPVGIRDWR
jgi:hypothetical protein